MLLDSGAALTLSLTPVLCDQLEAPGLSRGRGVRFIDEVRRDTHAEDAQGLRSAGHSELAAELDRSWSDYEQALQALSRRGGDLLGAFSAHARWTSSATHAVLPLLATDAGVRVQVQSGVDAHRAPLRRGLARWFLAARVRARSTSALGRCWICWRARSRASS